MKDTIVINLFGGPSCGKTTTAAGLFHQMKIMGYDVEYVQEWVREPIYRGWMDLLDQQEYILAQQNHRLHTLRGKVQYIITDSPLLLSAVYVDPNWPAAKSFITFAHDLYATYNNAQIFLHRPEKFTEDAGRLHNEEQSVALDYKILTVLEKHYSLYGVSYQEVQTDSKVVEQVLDHVRQFNY